MTMDPRALAAEQRLRQGLEEVRQPDGTYKIYRGVRLRNIDKLRTKALGIYWTYDRDAAVNYWSEGAESEYRGELYTLTALVPFDAIDWEQSVQANWYSPEEREVTLKPKSKVKLVSWVGYDEDTEEQIAGTFPPGTTGLAAVGELAGLTSTLFKGSK